MGMILALEKAPLYENIAKVKWIIELIKDN